MKVNEGCEATAIGRSEAMFSRGASINGFGVSVGRKLVMWFILSACVLVGSAELENIPVGDTAWEQK